MATPELVPGQPGLMAAPQSSQGGSKTYVVCFSLVAALIVLVLIVLVFNRQLTYWLRASLYTAAGMLEPSKPMPSIAPSNIMDEDAVERLNNPGMNQSQGTLPPGQTSDSLLALGYTGSVDWQDVMSTSELDPSTFVNHMDFVKDVRNFSSGAAFTDKDEDNNSFAFVNFIGLRRPQHVEIGASARQQPDIGDALKRNKPFVF